MIAVQSIHEDNDRAMISTDNVSAFDVSEFDVSESDSRDGTRFDEISFLNFLERECQNKHSACDIFGRDLTQGAWYYYETFNVSHERHEQPHETRKYCLKLQEQPMIKITRF